MSKSPHERIGKAITVRGPVEPEALGAVMMHEHLHSDWAQTSEIPFDMAKWPVVEKCVVPALKRLKDHGCFCILDMTRSPERAAPWVYQRISEMADFHIVLATGFYREIELGKYWAREPDDQIWPFVHEASVEELTEFCVQEALTGLHGTDVRAGVLKIGTSSKDLTEAEAKAAVAVARAQRQTGLLINTHANTPGAFKTQLELLESEGVDPTRVVLGHTQGQMVQEWPEVRKCMQRGATFAMTNLRMDVSEAIRQSWADAIVRAFDEGLGAHVTLGLDWGFTVGYYEFMGNPAWRPHQGDTTMLTPCTFMPPPAYSYLFEYTLPRFREMGVTDDMIRTMLVENPQRVIPVREP
ncbi:MAG: hypothetical protein GX620_15465 [Chloroflexi bacterium]|nr:hypothetical protein [Chloroflexota bacterium]